MTVQEIKELIGAFSDSEAVEMELKQSDIELALKKASAIPTVSDGIKTAVLSSLPAGDASQAEPVYVQEEQQNAKPQQTAEPQQDISLGDAAFTQVKAPLAGIFYRSSSPDAKPYVEIGQAVKKGETIGLIEAMKVMNEIPAPCDGVIENILADNEAFVGYEDLLMEIG